MDSKDNEFVSESQQVSVSNSTVTENVIWSIKGFKKSALESLKGRWKIRPCHKNCVNGRD